MINLFKEVLSMSLSGSLLIFLILLIKPIVKERFSKSWQYYLWIIVLIRLLLPFSPEFGMENNLFQQTAIHNYTGITADSEGTAPSSPVDNSQSYPDKTATGTDSVAGQKEQKVSVDLWMAGSYLWLSAVIILFLIKQVRYARFLKLMKDSSDPVADKRVRLIFEKAAKEIGLTRIPQLKVNDRIASPMLIGLVKPCVYLTDTTMQWDDARLYYVLRHELMHYKRHDLWYKWFSGLIVCIHWFNPLIAVMSRQINLQCEISCDEAVARDLSREEKIAYGNVLLDAVSENAGRISPVLSSTLYEDKKSMKERIGTIIMAKEKSKKSKVISVIITLVLCVAAFWLGAYTMGSKNTQKSTAGTANEQGTDSGQNNTSDNGTGNDTSSQSGDSTDSQSSENTQNGGTATGAADNSKDNNNTASGSDNSASAGTGNNTDTTATPTPDSTSVSEDDSIVYSNTEYGFDIKLPADWKDYTILEDTWQGTYLSGKDAGKVFESGTILSLRSPKWTKKDPYQDIPIMIFTKEQWKAIQAEEVGVSAAPVPPSKIAENSKYVFALPPRYNFAYPAGYEEVDKIMNSNPITGTENFK